MFIPLISAATAVFAFLTIYFRRQGKSFNGMLCKFVSSFGFMAIAFIGFCYHLKHPFYFCLVAFGLLFGLGGDVLLGIKEIAPKYKTKLIMLGTLSFLIGHVFYLSAFIKQYPHFSFMPLAIATVVTAIVAVLIKVVGMKVDTKMYVLMIVYFLLIAYCAAFSGYIYFVTRSNAFLLSFIASLLFILSDSVLGFVYFTPTKSKNKLVTIELSTYYIGQILMATTVFII